MRREIAAGRGTQIADVSEINASVQGQMVESRGMSRRARAAALVVANLAAMAALVSCSGDAEPDNSSPIVGSTEQAAVNPVGADAFDKAESYVMTADDVPLTKETFHIDYMGEFDNQTICGDITTPLSFEVPIAETVLEYVHDKATTVHQQVAAFDSESDAKAYMTRELQVDECVFNDTDTFGSPLITNIIGINPDYSLSQTPRPDSFCIGAPTLFAANGQPDWVCFERFGEVVSRTNLTGRFTIEDLSHIYAFAAANRA